VRLPQLLFFSVIFPVILLLLFNYVFGGAIYAGGIEYIQYLLPGFFVQTVLFGSTQTSVGLAEDLSKGIIDRFRSLPMVQPAVLAGRIFADTARYTFLVLLMIAVGTALGFRFQGGVSGWLRLDFSISFCEFDVCASRDYAWLVAGVCEGQSSDGNHRYSTSIVFRFIIRRFIVANICLDWWLTGNLLSASGTTLSQHELKYFLKREDHTNTSYVLAYIR